MFLRTTIRQVESQLIRQSTRAFTTRHTNAPPSSTRSVRWRAARGAAAATATATAGTALYALLGLKLDTEAKSSASFPTIEVEAEPSIRSPAPALSVEEATAKLRAQEGTLTFDAGGGHTGRFDYIRYASNSPVEDDYAFGSAAGPDRQQWQYWGLFDGHAGWATSAVLREQLIPYTALHLSKISQESKSSSSKVADSIKAAFLALDAALFDNAKSSLVNATAEPSQTISALAPIVSGSCALLSVYDPFKSVLRVACTGDSRAVLGTRSGGSGEYSARAMSEDQTGKNAAEYERISAAHPGEKDDVLDTKTGRLLGIAVTRAFGDHRWKWTAEQVEDVQKRFFGSAPRPKSKTPPYMTAEPVVEEAQIVRGGEGDFLIMASDGLWDHISNEDAVACVERWINAKQGGKDIRTRTTGIDTTSGEGPDYELEDGSFAAWKVKREDFVVEDDNAATHLIRNAFGGSKRRLFRTVMSAYYPMSRNVRDDVTVQVVFFGKV